MNFIQSSLLLSAPSPVHPSRHLLKQLNRYFLSFSNGAELAPDAS
jgi:hypothetical protein